jgi:hypothetical protein
MGYIARIRPAQAAALALAFAGLLVVWALLGGGHASPLTPHRTPVPKVIDPGRVLTAQVAPAVPAPPAAAPVAAPQPNVVRKPVYQPDEEGDD